MYPKIIHIYGPLAIYSYGLMILLGLIVFSWLFLTNRRYKSIVSRDRFFSIVSWSIVSGLIGGHVLYVLTEQPTFHALIAPEGLSLLGGIIGVLLFLPWYLRVHNVAILPFLDAAATYTPVIQGFGRIGCFLAGCCYGKATTLPWAITYTHPEVEAPLCIPLHPSQLYSALLLFFIAALLALLQHRFTKPGQMLGLYLALVSAERFVTDFFRYDHGSPLGSYQAVALLICGASLAWLWFLSQQNDKR